MKTFLKNSFLERYFKFLLVFVVLFVASFFVVSSASGVPDSYYANKEIQLDRDATLQLFVEIEASMKTSTEVTPAKFSELNGYFNSLFEFFPQDYAFKVIYQQCKTVTADLSVAGGNYQSLLNSFNSDCYKPLSDILSEINSKYTIFPVAKASPSNGPSPLTVTFDARGSIDPSNETVPSSNFFWYYRDIDGNDKTIGNAPVLNYTFDEPGNYLVHLTVRSSNKVAKGIFDGEKTLSIDVTPKTAIIAIYTNGQKMTKDDKIKLGTQEAERGVVFDASATIPMGGRELISHYREITSRDGFSYTKEADGAPGIIRVSLPGQGEFKITLTTTDNETNKVKETYALVVSDPVSIIKQTPDIGNTSTTFSFDANASYSVLSRLRLYTWEIFNQEGDKIEVFQGKAIKQQFKQPGVYTIKLMVEDEQGQSNFDTVQVYVESTDPIPQFEIKPTEERLYPSRFTLDATISSDIDKTNGFDELDFERRFPEELRANILQTEDNNAKMIVEFNGVGTYELGLVVKDQYGKISEIAKELKIDSTIRPELTITPVASYRGNPVSFVVNSNEPILNYQWDFGDGDTRILQTSEVTHVYKKTGVYSIKLSVDGANGNKNTVTSLVFVGEKDYPVAGYTVLNKESLRLTQNEFCTDLNGEQNVAYQIDRYADINIDPSLSVNSKGEKTDLVFYFQPGGAEIYKQNQFKYKFDTLGCKFIDLTVEDTSIGRNHKARIWFKVVNALPTLDNVVLFFPQYGNEMGVGFNENQVRDIFNDSFDPLIVKASATAPVDPDGNISYFKRYYYYKEDPTRIMETKITPSDVPYAFFSLPRLAGEFMFGVTMYDNDEGRQSSEEIIGNGPVVFFPPDASKPDVPLVTLKSNQSTVEVGDEVTFDVISKIISDRPDFVKERTIYYDFDGDGEWDLITKKDRVSYVYDTPSDPDTSGGYTPRASVLYRGYRGVTNGGKIIVKNGLKPKLLYTTYDKLAIFRDISYGDIEKKELCLDMKECDEENVITGGSAYSYEYPDYDKYFVSLDVSDRFANAASKKLAVTLSPQSLMTGEGFRMLAIPEPSISGNKIELFVGKNLDNAILYYLVYDNPRGVCYVDVDIAVDTDGDDIYDNDHDFNCNQLYLQKYQAKYDSIVGRVYYSRDDLSMLSKDFTVSFLDFEVNLSPEMKAVYDDISSLLRTMEGGVWETGINQTFTLLLGTLRDGLADINITKSSVVQISDYLENNEVELSEDQAERLDVVLVSLSDKAVVAAQGGSEYQKAKAEILSILPTNLGMEVSDLFMEFENVIGDEALDISQQSKRKEALQKIVNRIKESVSAGVTVQNDEIDKIDMDTIVIPNICVIMQFYSIPSELCSGENIQLAPEDLPVELGKSSSNLLTIVLVILGILVGAFVVIVVIFAVRAKMAQAAEESAGDELPQEPTPTETTSV